MAKYSRVRKGYKKRYNRKYRPVRAAVRRAVVKAKQSVFKKKVMKVISSVAEDKHAAKVQTPTVIPDVPVISSIFQLVPDTSVNANDNGRVGDEILAKSLSIKMSLNHITPASINVNDHIYYGVRVMIVQPRQFRGLTQIQANSDTWLSSLLRDGGSKVAWTKNNPRSMYLPINSDEIITYYDRKYFEHIPRINASGTLPTSYIYELTNPRSTIKELSLNLKVNRKKFKYDATVNGGLTPTNFNPVLIVGICNMTGYTNATSDSGMYFSYAATLTYEDV